MVNLQKYAVLQIPLACLFSLAFTNTHATEDLGGSLDSGGLSASSVYSTCSSIGASTSGTSLGGSLSNSSGSGTMDCASEDSDGDFMKNSWETKYSLNKNNKSDAKNDPDDDGASNQREAARGSIPKGSGTACPGFSTTTLTDKDCDGVTDGDDPDPDNASVTILTVNSTYKGGKLERSNNAE